MTIDRISSWACGSARLSSVHRPPVTTDGALVAPSAPVSSGAGTVVSGGGMDQGDVLVQRLIRAGHGVPVVTGADVGPGRVRQAGPEHGRLQQLGQRSGERIIVAGHAQLLAVTHVEALAGQRRG